MHRKAALGLTLLQILKKAIKPINAGIHVRNVGTQYSGIAVQLCKNIQGYLCIQIIVAIGRSVNNKDATQTVLHLKSTLLMR